jgi:beta-glucosidase
LIDDYEWAEGFTKRFGLAAVDFATQRRRLRPSAQVYRRIAASNRVSLDAVRAVNGQ